ncbi:putative helicase [Mycobacteroides abscessus subsp. abscessus]|uniref:helicase associated domain-containing protein n=1 Tax=Mycobacteroides abscessus TaxID=36809 RepID=UPI0009284C29|nr:helicase associated domain-containing protein [Mycobacteroides abscessus]SIL99909.1 putative helicase [Mycobacteroides abscessus subsp. abscessus]SLC79100.1 putative helicase [Mycobacteroides abscessus subsp. abscessus]
MNFGEQSVSTTERVRRNTQSPWTRHIDALARMSCAPGPDTEIYAWLVWAWCQEDRGLLTPAQCADLDTLPASVRRLRESPWVRRFLEVAARDRAGLSLAGEQRTPWLTYQRRLQARRLLPASRAALLERLDSFDWKPGDQRWWSTFEEVSRFATQHGRLPTRRDNEQLSNWVAVQRFLLRSDRLRYDRAKALAGLPGWMQALAQTRSRSPWERRCEQLRVFIQAQGRYPLLDSLDPGEAELARWVITQREQYRRDGLSSYRIKMLSALPFWRWGAREQAWDTRFRELVSDVRRGRFGPAHPDYGWVIAQRRQHRVGRLSDEQAKLLRSLNLLGSRLSAAA